MKLRSQEVVKTRHHPSLEEKKYDGVCDERKKLTETDGLASMTTIISNTSEEPVYIKVKEEYSEEPAVENNSKCAIDIAANGDTFKEEEVENEKHGMAVIKISEHFLAELSSGYDGINTGQKDNDSADCVDDICSSPFEGDNCHATNSIGKIRDINSGIIKEVSHDLHLKVCSICTLLTKPFWTLTPKERTKLIKDGPPRPEIPSLITIHKDKGGKYIRRFKVKQYVDNPWMCGCTLRNRLFCWPCILFSMSRNNVWCLNGFKNLNTISQVQKKHRNTTWHLKSCLTLENFKNNDKMIIPLNSQVLKNKITEHNLKVKVNREVMKRFIDLTCTLGKQGVSFSGRGDDNNFAQLLEFVKNYDTALREHLSISKFRSEWTNRDFQHSLIEAVAEVIRDRICEEIKSAPFVAVMCDETSDIQSVSQLSTVLRYTTDSKGNDNGKEVVERFIGLTDIGADKSADCLFRHIECVVERYKFAGKFVAQTYDGAAVASDQLGDLGEKVIKKYPIATHVHCYANTLNSVLSQSLTGIEKCDKFFSTMNGIAKFSSVYSGKLKRYLKSKIHALASNKWSLASHLIIIAHKHRMVMVEYFNDIVDNIKDCDATERQTAYGFSKFLQRFDTIFLLEVMEPIFTFSDVFFSTLQSPTTDCLKIKGEFEQFLRNMTDDSTNFQQIWNNANRIFDKAKTNYESDRKRKRSFECESDRCAVYKTVFFDIVSKLQNQISIRFRYLEDLEYFALLDAGKYSQYESTFPLQTLEYFSKKYGTTLFDCVKLKQELIVLYDEHSFKEKTVLEILKWFNTNFKVQSFDQVYLLAALICSIPAATSAIDRSSSALKRIKKYLKTCQVEGNLSHLSLIGVESKLLNDLRSQPTFYDEVIDKFVSFTHRTELMYYN